MTWTGDRDPPLTFSMVRRAVEVAQFGRARKETGIFLASYSEVGYHARL